jgi:hypothetical protein
MRRVSKAWNGDEGNESVIDATINSTGTVVLYSSWASNLVENDTNEDSDLFYYRLPE